jgi:hypothetical protein
MRQEVVALKIGTTGHPAKLGTVIFAGSTNEVKVCADEVTDRVNTLSIANVSSADIRSPWAFANSAACTARAVSNCVVSNIAGNLPADSDSKVNPVDLISTIS